MLRRQRICPSIYLFLTDREHQTQHKNAEAVDCFGIFAYIWHHNDAPLATTYRLYLGGC